MSRSSSSLRVPGLFTGRLSLWGAGVLCVCLFGLGCGARSSLEGSEAVGEGGATGTTTGSQTTSTTSTTTTLTTTSTTTTLTTTTVTNNLSGCADGQREGFLDEGLYPFIAACGGGFQVPGVLGELASPVCGQTAGDDSANPDGFGCDAWDLCAFGWHVCGGAVEVGQLSVNGCVDATPPGTSQFFITRQSGTGCGLCALASQDMPECSICSCEADCPQTEETSNDVFGCGDIGLLPSSCGVLNAFSDDSCGALGSPWFCAGDSCGEAHLVRKTGPEGGGVLCCMDMLD